MAKLKAGLLANKPGVKANLTTIGRAEAAGIGQVWSTFGLRADGLTMYAAAAMQTDRIKFGTSIVPTYTRHPSVMASQAAALEELAPGRLRLGIGPSHRPMIEGELGVPMGKPHTHLREYLLVLRALLWEGKVDFEGTYFNVHTGFAPGTTPPKTPILIGALRENAFRLAGELADGAISWVCPIPYLVNTALPALKAGAESAGRTVPPLVAHINVALSQDRQKVLDTARTRLAHYGHLPFYLKMFEDAGYPLGTDGVLTDGLLDQLVISGDAATIIERLAEIQAAGIDELLVAPLYLAGTEAEEQELLEALGQASS